MSVYFNTNNPTTNTNYQNNSYNKPTLSNWIRPFNFHLPSLKGLHEHIFTKLHAWETSLDDFLPNFPFQNAFDELCLFINNSFSVPYFNQWLDDNGHGDWHHKLATCLAKIPLRTARNIVRSLSHIVKLAVAVPAYAIVHPLKFPVKVLQYIASFINALTQPETWTRIGAGMVGSSLGHAALTSNPLSMIAIGIGAALSISGISLGTLKTALLAPKGSRAFATAEYVQDQAQQAAVDFLSGFGTVAVLEGVQAVMRGFQKCGRWLRHQHNISVSQSNMSREQANNFLARHNLPREEKFYPGIHYGLYWRAERLYGGGFKMEDLPGARFLFKDIQTGTKQSVSTVWNMGHYDSNGTYIDGHYSYVTTYTPVYEKFFGYELGLEGWVEPPMPPLGEAIRLNDKLVPYLGAAGGVDKLVEDSVKRPRSSWSAKRHCSKISFIGPGRCLSD